MVSNEHPDMSGNPCDAPIVCDQCSDACNESDLYGSRHDEEKIFCSSECVDDWEYGLAPIAQEESSLEIDDLLTIRDYLRERRDLLSEHGHWVNAQAIADEITLLSKLIAEAEAEAKP